MEGMLELGMDNYTSVVLAPQAGGEWRLRSERREMAAGEGNGRAGRPQLAWNLIWLSGLELQGHTNYQTKDLLSFALAFLWDVKQAQPPDVERTLYTMTNEAWKQY
jgi:hypothetical protein